MASQLTGEEMPAGPDEPAYEVERRSRAIILPWGNAPGRTEREAIEVLRVAALAASDALQEE
ncbi:hypothetical protein ACPXCO_24090 [Streptomyces cyaneofuscatus]|uniref:hypothetical protein n=1 Tax=Streptomyces cyaneofuscatus TaxID=66883 RepID=UPI003CF687FA